MARRTKSLSGNLNWQLTCIFPDEFNSVLKDSSLFPDLTDEQKASCRRCLRGHVGPPLMTCERSNANGGGQGISTHSKPERQRREALPSAVTDSALGKSARDESHAKTRKNGAFMEILLAIFDFLFGCHHSNLSRVFTLGGETYRVCCDCGAKYRYSLTTMSTERRIPLTPVLTRFRIA